MRIATSFAAVALLAAAAAAAGADANAPAARPVCVSGVYPHLALLGGRGNEWGIGTAVPWAGRLWLSTYGSGGGGGLFSLDEHLNLRQHVRGVAGLGDRLIHRESNQLFIASCVVDANGNVARVEGAKFRCTAAARHLTDPAGKIYIYGMEGHLVEVDVRTHKAAAMCRVQQRGVTGGHGKGGYSGQGRLVVANNGGTGGLAEWDGEPNHPWTLLARKQFCEVTGPGGIRGAARDDEPLWATGWDERSVILKVRDGGAWHTYRLPKASYTHDSAHGWFTEWPRIREVAPGRLMMNMHGMVYDFPAGFRPGRAGGLRPIATHLYMSGDWCWWNGRVVIARDDTSGFGNPLCGQAQSNLWFGGVEDLRSFGAPAGWGGPWIDDAVKAGQASEPFLIDGFAKRVVHVAHDADREVKFTLEADADGTGKWVEYRTLAVPARGYAYHVFPPDWRASWVRVRSGADCRATAYFHYSSAGGPADGKPREGIAAGLAPADRPGARSEGGVVPFFSPEGLLHFGARTVDGLGIAADAGLYQVDAALKIAPAATGAARAGAVADMPPFALPAGCVLPRCAEPSPYDKAAAAGWRGRQKREVVTERDMLNYQGTIYEVPRQGGIVRARPIATHGRLISDFCSWRGLLVLAGCRADAKADGHCFRSADGRAGLWFGFVEDLWHFGKPRGVGGPWVKAPVRTGAACPAYLMTGFDRKRLELSHDAPADVTFTIEVDFLARGRAPGDWHRCAAVKVPPGRTVRHDFPDGYSVHWVRLTAGADCTATAWFVYD